MAREGKITNRDIRAGNGNRPMRKNQHTKQHEMMLCGLVAASNGADAIRVSSCLCPFMMDGAAA
jgi:hypothetical protein